MMLICVYGLHRYYLVYLYYKHARNIPRVTDQLEPLPHVTVQLPMFNERYVAERVIEAAGRINYPLDRLEVQVLDDSTDDTVSIAAAAVERLRERGIDAVYIHRDNRIGYKAGALAEGLEKAKGELIAIFDADFIPDTETLYDTVHYFSDPAVGMVQARWDHINRDVSLLTKAEAILLDGHFVIEHGARCRSGRFMSFNGTAGVWRKTCIADAGGWQHDTLTEDLDLSYRAQMKGWRFLFLSDLSSPAELPPDIQGFKDQQHRWAKGGAQTCRKLLPTILKSKLPGKIKLEAFFHLTSCTVYFYMVILVLLLFPALWMHRVYHGGSTVSGGGWLLEIALFLVATCSVSTFYACSQRELLRGWRQSVMYLPWLMSLGVGISLNNARATLEGLFGGESEFVRTPKFGVDGQPGTSWKRLTAYRPSRKLKIQPFVELGIGLYLFWGLAFCITAGWITIGVPFMALFTIGYLYVGVNSLLQLYAGRTNNLLLGSGGATPADAR